MVADSINHSFNFFGHIHSDAIPQPLSYDKRVSLGRIAKRVLFYPFTLAIIALHWPHAHAWTEKALEVADPFSFPPNDLTLQSYKLESQAPGALSWAWVNGSFEWVRVDKKFLVPRAKLRLAVPPKSKVTYQKQLFLPSNRNQVDIPVVLTQEMRAQQSANEILIEDTEKKTVTPIRIVFQPKNIQKPLALDMSCSPFGIQVQAVKLPHSWVNIFCKGIHPSQTPGYGMKLNLEVYWEMERAAGSPAAPGTVTVNEVPVELEDGLTTSIAIDSKTQKFSLKRGVGEAADEFEFEIHVPERFHPLGVALGLGPYSHRNELRPFATVYASYFFNDAMKLALFGALPIKSQPETDIGMYLVAEQFRGFDEHMVVNLLLGAHALSFNAFGASYFRFSAPQGIELSFKDFLGVRKNITFGGFFYPNISNRSYINTWVRYGGSTFLELNFIQWQEPVGDETFEVKSFGLSIGFPLFRAL